MLKHKSARKQVKIVHLTSVHPSDDARIFYKECVSLAEAGYRVTLICPNLRPVARPPIIVHTVPVPRRRFERLTRTLAQVCLAALRERASVYHIHDPELIPNGLLLKLAGMRVIYDVHENVSLQIRNKYWIPRFLRRIVAAFARFLEVGGSVVFDGIVAATPAIAESFPAHKTTLLRNYPLREEFAVSRYRPYESRPSLISYVGGITEVRGIREIVQAMAALPEGLHASLCLAGVFGQPTLEQEIRKMPGWSRVRFLGWQSRQEIAALLSGARVGLVTLHPIPNYLDSYPVKLFEYMAAGVPVVASNFPLWTEILTETGCGLSVNPLDPKEIATAIQWLLEHPAQAEQMGERGRQAVFDKYNWDNESPKLLRLYKELTVRRTDDAR